MKLSSQRTTKASSTMNFSEYTFSLENLTYIPNIYEKIFIVLVWLLIEIPGTVQNFEKIVT